MKRRILAGLLTLCLVLPLFPVTANAASVSENSVSENSVSENSVSDESQIMVAEDNGVSTSTTWDGTSVDTNWYYDAEDDVTTHTIDTAAKFAGFASLVNTGVNFSGETVILGTDIDLADKAWTPIGYKGATFKGTFDGNNKTISNLVIDKGLSNTSENNGIGLFGKTESPAIIKNFVIENADVSGSLYVGAVVGLGYTGKEISNVTVKGDIAIDAWWYAGVIGGNGYLNTVTNCHVIGNQGSYIKGNDGSYIGGIWGFRGEGGKSITDCSVKNLSITGVDRVGGICGIAHYGNAIKENVVENISVEATDPEATTVGLVAGANQGTASEPSSVVNNSLKNVTAKVNGTEVKVLSGTTIDGSEPVTISGTDIVYDDNGKIVSGTFDKPNCLPDSVKEAISDDKVIDENGNVAEPDGNVTSGKEFKLALAAGLSEINLLADIDVTPAANETVKGNVIGANTVINGNGHKITYNMPYVAGLNGTQISALTVNNNAVVTVKELEIGGTCEYGIYALNGTVTVEDCIIATNTTTVQVNNSSKASIYGGKYSVTGEDQRYVVNYIDAVADKTAIKVYEGTFVNFNPADNAAENPKVNMTAENTHVAVNGNEYHVHPITAVAEKAATCATTGIKAHYTCVCGTLYSDAAGATVVTAADLVIPVKAHTYGEWKVTTAPTCTQTGVETRTCACGASEGRSVAATGHSYSGTLTITGSQHYHACACGSKLGAASHSYDANGTCVGCGYKNAAAATTPTTTTTTTTTTSTTASSTTKTEETKAEETVVENAVPEAADTTVTQVVANEKVVETVKETVTVTEGTAAVDKAAVEAVVEATEEGEAVVLPLTQTTEESVEKAEVSTEALTAVAENETDVVIELTEVTVKLDAAALKAVTEQAAGETIEIRAVKTETAMLTEEQQAGLADKETAVVITAQIFSDGEYIGDFQGGKATIMFPFEPEEGKDAEDYTVYFVDDDGVLHEVASEYVDGHMVFTTGHFSDYVIVYEGAALVGTGTVETPEEEPAVEKKVAEETEEAVVTSSFPVIPVVIALIIAVIVVCAVVLSKKRSAQD